MTKGSADRLDLPEARSTYSRHEQVVEGVALDAQTRCAHYRSPLDIIAIKTACCATYYACKDCHDELAGHPLKTWPRIRWDEPAVYCGACTMQLTINQYLTCGSQCPQCAAAFNPGCRNHHHFYFADDRTVSGDESRSARQRR